MLTPLDRFAIDARELAERFPPKFAHPNKRLVHSIACPPGARHAGTVTCSRWPRAGLPDHFSADACEVGGDIGIFRYQPSQPGVVDWHLNFADSDLFAFYGSGLLAQDELQVAEHPALASLRECLVATDRSTRTRERGLPTPILVTGVERRVQLLTDPDPAVGRPNGLYGNSFASATAEAIRAAAVPIQPPSRSNIVAMAAPGYGSGRYSRDEITGIFEIAFSAFLAAREETAATFGPGMRVAVHTGFWGCGAFGGNRILMTILQILAAHAAGVDSLIYHTVDVSGATDFNESLVELDSMLHPFGDQVVTSGLIDAVDGLGLEWGRSNGT